MIQIKSLNKTFGRYQVLKDISLDIPEGYLLALLGPNGSGKSTLLKSLLKVIPPDSGELLGLDSHTSSIGYMPQNPAFPRNLKAKELIQLFEYLTNQEPKYKEELISALGISAFLDKKTGQLSQGMKQKLNILQCFMFNPSFIILDEPSAGLDPSVSYYFKEFLNKRRKEGKTILFTSHIMSEVQEVADEVAVLIEGRIVLHSKPSSIIREAKAKNLEEAIRIYWSKNQKIDSTE